MRIPFAILFLTLIGRPFADSVSVGADDSVFTKSGPPALIKALLPGLELSVGFQAPIFHGGALHSEIKRAYPDNFNTFHVFNYGWGLYLGDMVGFGYQKSIGGGYHVSGDPAGNRNMVNLDYSFSKWVFGGRVNILYPFQTAFLKILPGYHIGFIHALYEINDSTLSRNILGIETKHKIGALGQGITHDFSLDVSHKSFHGSRSFIRFGYNLHAVEGYDKRLETGKTIHLLLGILIR